jgi:ATPase involved in DNA replication initiation
LLAGATGLGKTHLAHAVTAECAIRPGRVAVLLTADEFLRELAEEWLSAPREPRCSDCVPPT